MEEDESSLVGKQNFYTCPHFFLKRLSEENCGIGDTQKKNKSKQTDKQITSSAMIGNYRKIPRLIFFKGSF